MVRFQYILDHQKIVQGFGHLFVVDVHESIMHPIAGERFSVGGFGLGDFVFMMGKYQVLAATVNIKGFAKKPPAHGRTFNMPSRSPLAPGAWP